LEDAIKKFSGEEVTLYVAGRTDTGVHARAQAAHFDLEKKTSGDVIRDALNFHVRPHKVVVLEADAVSSQFHSRFDALNRSYKYLVINRRAPLTLETDQAWHVPKPLNIPMMQAAAQILIGKHNFSTFRAQHCQSNSPIRTLDRMEITSQGETVIFETQARSFLYHQVRNMVGTLVMVGTCQWSIDDFKTAFDACDRKAGGPTAPPQGLYFMGVNYPA